MTIFRIFQTCSFDVFDIITMGPLEIAQMRIESLQKLNVLRKKLEGTEEKLHANLPEHLRPILKGKHLTLFEKDGYRC